MTTHWTTTLQVANVLDDSTSGGTTVSRLTTHRDQATWQNALEVGAGQQLVLAYEHLDERASGDSLASEAKRHNNALVLGYSGTLAALGLQADVRRDDNSVYGVNSTGRIGWSRELLAGLKLRALAGTTFRAPTFNDLYFPFFGIPTLHPARARAKHRGRRWTGSPARPAQVARRSIAIASTT